MGGKSKSSQRTKNNVRPSSSGRSAVLLQPGPQSQAPSLSSGLALFSSLASEPPLPPSLVLPFKKLGKKDPITRVKGLQELSQLVSSGEHNAAVVAALPAWSSQYRSLAQDPERRVREQAQVCHALVVSCSGRSLAPVLRRALPPWLLGAHDPHPPAARAARSALDNTFPGTRLREAVLHCRKEIMDKLHDELTTPIDISKIKSPEEEEAATMFASRAASALGALQEVVECMASTEQQWMQPAVDALLADGSFWKLGRHSDTRVRWSWYRCVGSLSRYGLLGPLGPKLATALLGPKEAAAGLAAHARWEALLELMRRHQDWSSWMDLALLETRLMGLLESGGWGDARALRALVRELLTMLPPPVITTKFYTRLFDAVFTGLESKAVMQSTSERTAYCGIAGDCVRRWTDGGAGSGAEGADSGAETLGALGPVVGRQLARWVQAALRSQHLVRPTALALSNLATHWLRSGAVSEPHALWWAVTKGLAIDGAAKDTANTVTAHALLLRTMWTAIDAQPARKCGVTFQDDDNDRSKDNIAFVSEDNKHNVNTDQTSGDSEDNDVKKINEDISSDTVPLAVKQQYLREMQSVTSKVIAQWLEYGYNQGALEAVVPPIVDLLTSLDSKEVWTVVAMELGCRSVYELYSNKLGSWLREGRQEVAALALAAVNVCSEEERQLIYTDFEQLEEGTLQRLVAASVRSGARWAGGRRGGAALRAAVRGALQGDHPAAHIVTAALTDSNVPAETVEAVSTALCSHLQSLAQSRAGPEQCLPPLLPLLPPLARSAPATHRLAPLCTALLQLILHLQPDDSRLSRSDRSALLRASRSLLQSLHPDCADAVFDQLYQDIRNHLNHSPGEVDWGALRSAALAGAVLASCRAPPAGAAGCGDVTAPPSTSPSPPPPPAPLAALRGDVLSGLLHCPVQDSELTQMLIEESKEDKPKELTLEALAAYLREVLFRALVLREIVASTPRDTEPTEPSDTAEDDKDDSPLPEHDDTCDVTKAVDKQTENGPTTAIDERLIEDSGTTGVKLDVATDSNVVIDSSVKASNEEDKVDELKEEVDDSTEANRETADTSQALQQEMADDSLTAEGDIEDMGVGKLSLAHSEAGGASAEAEEEEYGPPWLQEAPQSVGSHWLAEQMADTLYHRQVLAALQRNMTYWSHWELVQWGYGRLSALAVSLQRSLPGYSREAWALVPERLQSEAARRGHYWALAAVERGVAAPQHQDFTGDGFFHTLQAQSVAADASFRLSTAWAVLCRAVHARLAGSDRAAAQRLTADAAMADHSEEERTDLVLRLYHETPDVFHIDAKETIPSWEAANAASALSQYLSCLVSSRGWELPAPHWDLATLHATAAIQAAWRARDLMHNTKVSMMTASAVRLVCAVLSFVRSVPARCERQQPAPHVAALPREWADLFEPEIRPRIHDLLMHLLQHYTEESMPSTVIAVAAALSEALPLAAGGPGPANAASRSSLATAAGTALAGPASAALHVLAYHTLCALAPRIREDDELLVSEWSTLASSSEAAPPPPPLVARALAGEVRAALVGGQPEPRGEAMQPEPRGEAMQPEPRGEAMQPEPRGEAMQPEPRGEAMQPEPRGALLLAIALHRVTGQPDSEECSDHYYLIYKEFDFVQPLISLALRSLPPAIAAYAYAGGPLPASAGQLFLQEPALAVTERVTLECMGGLWCHGLYSCLSGAGSGGAALAYGALEPRQRRGLGRLARGLLSPHIVAGLLRAVAARCAAGEPSLAVAARLSSGGGGELVAAIEVEERRVELRVTLAPTHPLAPPRLHGTGVAAPPAGLARLALRGSSAVGLATLLQRWAGAALARVEGKPPCYVCYCRLHPTSRRLPSLACRQCANKFHAECIRKWFATSQKANCPLCRSIF